MKLTVKRAHIPYPGVRLPAGLKMVIEPDEIAEAIIRRGWADLGWVEESKPEPIAKTKKAGK
jgi:hypothetical protein